MWVIAFSSTLNFMQKLNKFQKLEIFLMNDQPFTCPYCGSRCTEIANFYHTNSKLLIVGCLNEDCGFVCGEEEDEEFSLGNYNSA
jgi:hypothetical protein